MLPDPEAPATKADIAELAAAIKADIAELAAATKADIAEVAAATKRVETNLLTEFHRWAQTYEVRARGTVQAVHNFEERLMLIEERVAHLERRREERDRP